MKNLERIAIYPNVMNGKPTKSNLRFTVALILELITGGMTFQEILDNYLFIKKNIHALFRQCC